jgi:ribosomal protein S18 acetylase RimI-like enzyme
MEIRDADASDDASLVRFYLALWKSYGTPAEHFLADAEVRVLAYIAESRKYRRLGVFVAEDDGRPIGVAAAEIYRAPYPEVVARGHRHFGYIWCVFVDEAYRRRGIARALTERAVAHLRSIGCTTAVLNSSDPGQPLYEQIGFVMAKEMRMALK